ncbi:MAG: hypothetical protein QNJ64_14455 [Crocosphaera sp.]|nr:hypothetical protein [Crocosphaera sp.]
MKNHTGINPSQKIFMNVSLILFGICANGTFFTVIVTLLLGSVALTWLRHQQGNFALNVAQTDKGAEKLPVSRS